MPFLSACAESDKTSRGIRVHEPPQLVCPSLRFSLRSRKRRGETSKSGRFWWKFSSGKKFDRFLSVLTCSPLLETRINKEWRKKKLEGKEGLLLDSPTENGYTRVRILDVLLCRRHPHVSSQPLKRIL